MQCRVLLTWLGLEVLGVALGSATFWKTKVLLETETFGVADVREERRRRVAVLCRRNDPHCGRCWREIAQHSHTHTHTHTVRG